MASARRALKFATDLRTLTHAELILSSEQADWQILPPRLVDVMDFPTFLPEDTTSVWVAPDLLLTRTA